MTHQIKTPAHYSELFLNVERAKLELLKINEKIGSRRRAFFEDGISTPGPERSAMNAEQQRLEVLVQQLKLEALEARQAAREVKTRSFLEILIAKTKAAGLITLVDEAHAESLEAVDAFGLRQAYRMKGLA